MLTNASPASVAAGIIFEAAADGKSDEMHYRSVYVNAVNISNTAL
jgi:hypothetical protein